MRLHFHQWTYKGSGYLEWVPYVDMTKREKQWIAVYECTKCPAQRCTISDRVVKDAFGHKSWIKTAPWPAVD